MRNEAGAYRRYVQSLRNGAGSPSPILWSSILQLLARRALVLAGGPYTLQACNWCWSEGEGKKKGDGGEFPGNLGKALGQLGPCTAPGVVLFSEDPPSEIAQPYGNCQQIMRLGPFPSHSFRMHFTEGTFFASFGGGTAFLRNSTLSSCLAM